MDSDWLPTKKKDLKHAEFYPKVRPNFAKMQERKEGHHIIFI